MVDRPGEAMTWTLHVEEEFSAAHANGPAGHRCNTMHGHDWVAIVEITYDAVDENGWGPDFGAIKAIFKPLDHENLNEFFDPFGLKPSAELIAMWAHDEIIRTTGYRPDFVTICEGGTNRVTYREDAG